MTTSDHLSADELMIRMRERIAELEKENKALNIEILEHKRTEEALRKSEERYRILFTNMTEAFFLAEIICDKDGKPYDYRYLETNPACELNTGVKKGQIAGKSHLEVFPNASPTAIEEFGKVALSGKSAHFEIFSQATCKYLEIYAFSPEKGKLAVIFRDVTERKQAEKALREAYENLQMQSEELQVQTEELHEAYESLRESENRYRLLFDHSLDAIILTDPRGGGKILSANPAACRILGWSEEELIGKGRDVMFAQEDPALSTLLNERARWGSARVQIIYRRKDGTTFPGEVSSALFTDVNGETRAVAIIRDVTERKQAEEKLQQAYEELEGKSEELQAQAVELMEANEALIESEKRFKLLSEANALLLSSKNPEAMIQTIAEKVMHHLNCDVFFNYVFDKIKGKLHLNAFGGISAEAAKEIEWLDKGTAICGCVALDGCRIVSEDVQHNGDKRADLIRSMGIQAYACHPLHIGEKTIGTLSFGVKNRKDFTLDELALMSTVADQVSVAIERKQAEEALWESQSRLETVFSAIPDAIIEYEATGKPVRANEAAIKAYGLRLPDLTRDKAIDILKIEHMDNSPVRIEELPTSRALKGEVIEGELYRFTDAEGKELIITTYVVPLFKDNKISGAVALWHDITELKRAEEDLRQSENLYRSIAKNLPNGTVYVFDRSLRFLVVDGEALERIGWSQEKLEGKSVYDLEEETRKIIEPRYRSVLAGQSLVFETSYRGREILSQYVPIQNDNGEIFAGMVMGLDITERKAVELELSHQREVLQHIFDNIPVLLVMWDPHLERFTLNRHAEQVLGWTTADANDGDFMARVYPDASYRAEVSDYMLSLATGWREWICTTKNGQHVPIDWANIFLTDNTMIGIGVDLRERKRAEKALKRARDNLEKKVKERTAELEEAYNSLLENEMRLSEAQKIAHLGNWDWNLLTGKLYWSDEIYRIFGLDPLEFGRTYDEFLSYVDPEDRNTVNNAAQKALKGDFFSTDYRIILPDGEKRIVHAQGEAFFDEKHTPVRVRGILQDITERKMAEEALAKMEKIRIKEIHHRIKNNLQVICSLLSLEAERFSDEKMLEAFRESQNRVASMALIHEELYRGKRADKLDFAAYLRKLTADLFSSYNLGSDNVSLKMDLEQVYLDMDTAIPLGIIVNELVSNSLKHAFPKGKKGEININICKTDNFAVRYDVSNSDLDCMENSGFQYILKVTDNGRGIPEGINLQDTDSLGLQLVNILVDQIEGCIELGRDKGTEFIIWFGNKEK